MGLRIELKGNFVKLVSHNETDHIIAANCDFDIDTNGKVSIYDTYNKSDIKSDLFSNLEDKDGNPLGSTIEDVENWLTLNIGTEGDDFDESPSPSDPLGTTSSLTAVSDGFVAAGAKSVSFIFRGNGGTLNGAVRPNGYAREFKYPNGESLPRFDYTVPTNGLQRILIDILF